jgi:hypothetical protein
MFQKFLDRKADADREMIDEESKPVKLCIINI